MRIEGKNYKTIWFDKNSKNVKIIDQTKLPHEFKIKELETVKDPLEKELKLRRFEYGLIVELGYEFSLMDDNIGRKIEGSKFYEFVPNRGFQETNKKGNNTCSGITIINFNNGIIENDQAKQFLKYIMI